MNPLKTNKNFALEIRDSFRGARGSRLAVYFSNGTRIIAHSTINNKTAHKLCEDVAEEIDHEVSVGTLRNCVQLARTYSTKQQKTLCKAGVNVSASLNLAHSQYDLRRGVMVTEIGMGKRNWWRITAPARENEKARQRQVREEVRADAGHDPTTIGAKKIIVDGEIDEEAIKDVFLSVITRTSLELASRLFEQAKKRIKKQ